eukprot:scaffold358_cov256-Pinguiococcus_pyrenoidosus.AAC.34
MKGSGAPPHRLSCRRGSMCTMPAISAARNTNSSLGGIFGRGSGTADITHLFATPTRPTKRYASYASRFTPSGRPLSGMAGNPRACWHSRRMCSHCRTELGGTLLR